MVISLLKNPRIGADVQVRILGIKLDILLFVPAPSLMP